MPSIDEWIAGATTDSPSLPLATCNAYRGYHHLPPLPDRPGTNSYQLPALWHTSSTSLGAGESFAQILRWWRLKSPAGRSIKWYWSLSDCGCRAGHAKIERAMAVAGVVDAVDRHVVAGMDLTWWLLPMPTGRGAQQIAEKS